MKKNALATLAMLMSSSAAFADFQADPTFIVTTVEKGKLAPDVGTSTAPVEAGPVIEAFKKYLSDGCREAGGKPEFKPDFATAVDVNGDGRADVFMTANRMNCDAAASYWSGSAGTTARWALSKSDGTYAVLDQLHHQVEIQETATSGYQITVHLHGMNCGKGGAAQCRHVSKVDKDGRIQTLAWPDGKHHAVPDSSKASTAQAAKHLPPVNATAGSGWSSWTHNGSTMLVDEKSGRIVYDDPKASIAGTITKGTVLFEGRFESDQISGTAYVFKRGCDPASYTVSGRMESNPKGFGSRIVLSGIAPKRDKSSCAIVGSTSTHSKLVFEELGDI